ncbi:3-deoxy-D-manno-octulosonic acid transferase [Suttonella sp. R2A3]|uniref:3-deoxy-D-manno-octulosonic acid transferase n=1 Tax=Suttonella sp. R2A3 TaxID=2908648 RepID=UPI001F46E09E|nr:3-deoxy-D-manno-octulosonic acid transferase [Suttonella sp. R2A3]UJF24146.1 3-deoxy-D-manno-octulosonic acid transferase [Suttonella sp. R2A3]
MIRPLYTLLLYIALPFVLIRLLWKSHSNADYRRRISERFARHLPARSGEFTVLFHTVSVGEFLAAKPLLNALLAKHPSLALWITCTTPTGSAQIQAFQQTQPERITHSYLPYDTPAFMRRFLHHVRPKAVILMETEIWPNLILAANHSCPVLLINARLSARSLRGYYRFAKALLARPLSQLYVNAQTEQDARRLQTLGVPKAHITITANLKYQLNPQPRPENIPEAGPPIWIAASTHPGEEQAILTAQRDQLSEAGLRLIIAPRHPERRAELCKLVSQHGFTPRLRSQNAWFQGAKDVLILDTLGELAGFFPLTQVAFIGGSLIPRGGHNPLEAVHAGCRVCFGSSMYNFQAIRDELVEQPFAREIDSVGSLGTTILSLYHQDGADTKAKQQRYIERHQQILEQHLAFIESAIMMST